MTFPPGVFTQTITLDTVPDVPVEGNEDLQVLLSTVDARVGVFQNEAVVIITEDGKYDLHQHYLIDTRHL